MTKAHLQLSGFQAANVPLKLLVVSEFDLCKLFTQQGIQIDLKYYILRNVLAKDSSNYKRKMAFLET